MRKLRVPKLYIRILILTIIISTILFLIYNVVFVSDIPYTIPNSNQKAVHEIEIKADTLVNYWGDTLSISSGTFIVKESRSTQDSNHIELYFNRINTTSKKPIPPIFFFAGGPGSSSTAIGRSGYFYLFKELSKYADIILMDQRGTGHSIPNLSCRNFVDPPTDKPNTTQKEILDDIISKCKECAEEFKAMSIDLSSYNSLESVHDIDELRQALGYDKITLYGYSYGTELAQHYIKNFEPHVEKAVFAGAIGPDHGLKMPLDIQKQFEVTDSLIKLDKRLSKYIPDYMGLVKGVYDKLKIDPQYIKMPVIDAFGEDPEKSEENLAKLISIVKPSFNLYLTYDFLQMMVSDNIGNDNWIGKYPSYFYNLDVGKYREVARQLRNFARRRLPNALFFTANASSGYSEALWKNALEQEEQSLFSHFGISYGRYPEVYKSFGIEKIEGLNTPISSDINSLFIIGTLDGRTPIRYATELEYRFPNNHKIIINNVGHNRLLNNQVMEGLKLFIQDSLTDNIEIYKSIAFDNPVPYKYSILDTLTSTIDSKNVSAAILMYQGLQDKYEHVDDYIFEFSPDPFYNLAEHFIDNDQNQDCIDLLSFAIDQYPNSYLLHVYLALAYQNIEKVSNARFHALKARELNYFDGNAHIILNQLNNL